MMLRSLRQVSRSLIVCTLVASFGAPASLSAQAHVVSPAELQSAIVAATQARQKNRDTIASFLSTAKADKALRTAHIDVKQVKNAVASLNDEEAARLASRVEQVEADFAAGRISDRDLLLILLGIAALILIIVAVD